MGKKAFTLIELALVLAVIGIMVGGSFKAMKMIRERSKLSEAKEQVMMAKNAVVGYAIEWPSLPDEKWFDANVSKGNDSNFKMHYIADETLKNPSYDVCNFNTTTLEVIRENINAVSTTTKNVAFVIIHGGLNNNIQTAKVGNTVTIHLPSDKVDDNMTTGSINGTDMEYDDIVEVVTLSQLQGELGCADNPFKIVNNSLPNAKVGNWYSTLIVVDGNYSQPTENNCTLTPLNGLEYLNYVISGTPTTSGVTTVSCIVVENNRSATKMLTIAIDPNTNRGIGNTCTSDTECSSGICANGFCSGGFVNNNCADNSECVSGPCVGGLCTNSSGSGGSGGGTNLPNGTACSSGSVCASGYCVSGVCSANGGVASGSSCTADSQCSSGHCVSGKCNNNYSTGTSCTHDWDCASNDCSNGSHGGHCDSGHSGGHWWH